MNSASLISVHELTQRIGLTRKTLYYYDRIGLLKPSGRLGKQKAKLYSEADIRRLEKIIAYKDAGLKLSEIHEVLEDQSREKEYLKASVARQKEIRRKTDHTIACAQKLIDQKRKE